MIAARLVAALAATGVVVALGACGRESSAPSTVTIQRTTRVEVARPAAQAAGGGSFDAAGIYARAAPGVVTVVSTGLGTSSGEGVGSGFVVSDTGEIATNAHVVTSGTGSALKPAGDVYVSFADGNQVPARIVGFDPFVDVALLKVDPAGLDLVPVPLGSAKELHVGAPVAAIGSPFGEDRSLSVGIISATGRSIDSLTGFSTPGAIQTDAAINQGNSGGPLLDARGRVLGINSQIETASGGGSGVGFAVPVDAVRRSLHQLRMDGRPRYAYIGVASTPVYPQLAAKFGLGTKNGAWVQELTPGGPAAQAGIHVGSGNVRFQARDFVPGGDVIVAIDGASVRDEEQLAARVADLEAGRRVAVTVVRDGRRRTVDVKLGERPVGALPRG